MRIKLTRRQQAFLDKLFDLYREFGQPVHYSVVAERLGVNRFSAYDMLKTLEEKGVAASAYAPKRDQRGPGRSMVLFYPTYRAAKFLTQLRQDMFGSDEWSQFKESVLRQLRQALESNSSKTVRDLLSQLPSVKTPLAYCTEMVGVLLLNLAQCQTAQRSFPLGTLQPLTVGGGPIGLGTLAGLSLGSLVSGSTDDPSFAERLTHHIHEFQEQLNELSEESLNRLNAFLQDALKAVESTRRANKQGESPGD
ncbi:MAG: hypothetical protein ACP5R2_13000 [Anaerolineae bacterium]